MQGNENEDVVVTNCEDWDVPSSVPQPGQLFQPWMSGHSLWQSMPPAPQIHIWSFWAGTVPIASLSVLHVPMFLPP